MRQLPPFDHELEAAVSQYRARTGYRPDIARPYPRTVHSAPTYHLTEIIRLHKLAEATSNPEAPDCHHTNYGGNLLKLRLNVRYSQ
jgi:hypothetical protein